MANKIIVIILKLSGSIPKNSDSHIVKINNKRNVINMIKSQTNLNVVFIINVFTIYYTQI